MIFYEFLKFILREYNGIWPQNPKFKSARLPKNQSTLSMHSQAKPVQNQESWMMILEAASQAAFSPNLAID